MCLCHLARLSHSISAAQEHPAHDLLCVNIVVVCIVVAVSFSVLLSCLLQCYAPPAGFRCITEAFAEFPAPKVGIAQYCLGHVANDLLSSVEDRMEDVTGIEPHPDSMQQIVTAGGLVMPMSGSSQASITAIVESRYFGANGGGRNAPKHGWAGSSDNFPQGAVLMEH